MPQAATTNEAAAVIEYERRTQATRARQSLTLTAIYMDVMGK